MVLLAQPIVTFRNPQSEQAPTPALAPVCAKKPTAESTIYPREVLACFSARRRVPERVEQRRGWIRDGPSMTEGV